MVRFLQRLWMRPALLLWLPPAFWAGNLVLGRALGGTFPPVSLAVGRWAVALAALLPFVARRAWHERGLMRAAWPVILACGAFGVAGYNALAYVALQTAPAANVAFLNSTLPLMVPVAALVLTREPLRARTLFGIAVSFVGVAWIVSRGDLAALAALRIDGGEILVLIAVANYALYSVLLRRKPVAIDPLVFLAATMAVGLAVLAPFWALELWRGARIPLDPMSVAAVVYIGLFASLFAFILWNRCVAQLGATVTGISFHLVAVFTAVLAFTLLGETVRMFHLIGIALILAGFFLSTTSVAPLAAVGPLRS
jgi:drug/metabolite transporter (DMT)-like permease